MQGIFLILIMHDQLGRVFRAALWMVSWRLIMGDPLKWARSADEWADAQVPIWNDDFREVHFYMMRALIAYLLFEIATLLRATATSYLTVRFHHQKFFKTMQASP